MAPTARVSLSSDLFTAVATTEPEESSAAQTRLKNPEAKSALVKKAPPGHSPAPSGDQVRQDTRACSYRG